jgi:hypothetical protein
MPQGGGRPHRLFSGPSVLRLDDPGRRNRFPCEPATLRRAQRESVCFDFFRFDLPAPSPPECVEVERCPRTCSQFSAPELQRPTAPRCSVSHRRGTGKGRLLLGAPPEQGVRAGERGRPRGGACTGEPGAEHYPRRHRQTPRLVTRTSCGWAPPETRYRSGPMRSTSNRRARSSRLGSTGRIMAGASGI